jgi:DNA-binding MarR family transcriptional regulator
MRTSALAVKPATNPEPVDQIGQAYQDVLTLVERLHRRLLDVIRDEFDQRDRLDLNPVQALLLYNIGEKELTASELRTRGYYLGSNVSYNLKKLTEDGFLDHQRSRTDRRSVRISLTEKGRDARDIVAQVFARHLVSIADEGRMGSDDFTVLNKALLRLEREL